MALFARALALLALLATGCGGGGNGSPSLTASAQGRAGAARAGWEGLAAGLEVARFEAPGGSPMGEATLTVVRVDPARYRFRLLSAKLEKKSPAPTIEEWVEQHGVVGAINASMYQADHLTSVGFLRDGNRFNHRGWSRDKAVFVAEPTRPGLPRARLLDRTCEDARAIARGYRLVVQSIRMIDCRGRNVWAPSEQRWSVAAVGVDEAGRVLLAHCRRPVRAHDFVNALLALPLGLRRLMYVEGGPQAALHVRVGGRTVVSEVGRPLEGGLLAEAARIQTPLPNAIAFSAR